jgi:GNAT superfamily N-acetyltransferase
MIQVNRTNSDDADFIELVKHLDAELAVMDGEDHAFYAQFNKLDKINEVVVLSKDGRAIACGAFKKFGEDSVEIKRMFVVQKQRGNGYASSVLKELETWAKELAFNFCVLETGARQKAAMALYEKNGYQRTENFGPYLSDANSRCFAKAIN